MYVFAVQNTFLGGTVYCPLKEGLGACIGSGLTTAGIGAVKPSVFFRRKIRITEGEEAVPKDRVESPTIACNQWRSCPVETPANAPGAAALRPPFHGAFEDVRNTQVVGTAESDQDHRRDSWF